MRIYCFVFLFLAFCGSALATGTPDLTPEERLWLAKNKDSLVLIHESDFPPFEFATPAAPYSGLSADLISIIEERLGIRFRKQAASWSDVLKGIQDGTAAACPAIVNTPERSKYAYFTPAYISTPFVIVTSRDVRKRLTLDDLTGMRVAVVRGYASAGIVREAGQGRFTISEVETIREGLRDVSFGVADAFVESLAVAAWYIEEEKLPNLRVAGDLGRTQSLSIGISRHYPLLASAMTKALASIPQEDIDKASNRWIHLATPILDQATKQRLLLTGAVALGGLSLLSALAWLLRRKLRRKVVELENTKAALTDQIERFQLAMEATKAGYWEYYPEENREEHSREWFSMLGYSVGKQSASLESWSNLVHPADREQARKSFMDFIRDGGNGMYEAEYRMRADDGSWRWVLGKGQTVARDENGRPRRIIGLNIDIDKSRQAQDEVQRYQALYMALLEQTTQFTGLLNRHGILLAANATALEWAGTASEDVVGKPFWEGPWWPDKAEAESMLRQVIEEALHGHSVRREVFHRRPDGGLAIFDFRVSPFRDERGKVVNLIAEGREITESKRKQQAVEESEKRFRTIFENAPYSVAINRLSDGKYMDANTAFLERFGISREDLQTLTLQNISSVSEEHREEIFLALRHAKNVHNMELRVHRPNGAIGYLLYSGGLITLDGEPCILSMTVDITELKNAQEALRRSEEMFSKLFHLSPDVITLARQEDGALIEVNETFTRFTGYSREEAIGRTTLELGIFPSPAVRNKFILGLRRDRQIENFEFQWRHRDGTLLSVSTSARLTNVNDIPCVLAITRDMTQLRALQENMVQSEKMLSLGGIAAGIAHEINNPLGIVLQGAQTISLRTQPDFPKNREVAAKIGVDLEQVERYLKERKIDVFIRDIQGAAVRAAEIIRHMLDFSRRSESRRSVCNIAMVIEHALTLASSDYDLKKNYDFKLIDVVKDIAADLPPCECTETEIEQVMLNLLRNAAQAMADAEPPIVSPQIRISAGVHDKSLRIVIEDNGPGIPEKHRSRIFEPFFTTKKSGAGTGLGLSVSYFIVTKGHGGQMSVSCPPEGGTIFTIDLPGMGQNEETPRQS